MKVLLINGSPRQNGNTATIAVCRGDEPWAPMHFIR